MIQTSHQKLSDIDFKRFSSMVFEKSGIVISNDKRTLLESRLAKRLRDLNINNFSSYYHFLQKDIKGNEMIKLLDAVTTNVTSFFREDDHFKILSNEFLEKKLKKIQTSNEKNEIVIWSAGCSSGEEPYSIVISLLEALKDRKLKIRILATDLSLESLKKAQNACYEKSLFSKVPTYIISKYFDDRGHHYQVKEKIRKCVTFRQFNFKNSFHFKHKFDAIFCRNVMIYFDQDFRNSLVKRFFENLKSGGLFFLGLSESLGRRNTNCIYHSPSAYLKR